MLTPVGPDIGVFVCVCVCVCVLGGGHLHIPVCHKHIQYSWLYLDH